MPAQRPTPDLTTLLFMLVKGLALQQSNGTGAAFVHDDNLTRADRGFDIELGDGNKGLTLKLLESSNPAETKLIVRGNSKRIITSG